MEVGAKVKVNNPHQINYPLEGVVIETTEVWEVPMSKVKFTWAEVWYANEDLKEVQ